MQWSSVQKWMVRFVAPGLIGLASGGPLGAGEWFGWLTSRCDTPPGSRQRCHNGKVWPLEARPSGPMEPLVHQYHTAHYWPDPYRWRDRDDVRSVIALQRDNGWTVATTLYDQHFDSETNEINEAGRMHLRWILIHAPLEQRTAWVQGGFTEQISQVRLQSVQAEAVAMCGPNHAPVLLRVTQPYGRSASEVDLINRTYLSTIPKPRVPFHSQTGTTGEAGSTNQNSTGGSP